MLQGTQITPKKIDNIVVLLHGFGANGANLYDIAQYWSASLPNTLFTCPDAPNVLAEDSYYWFKIHDFDNITPQSVLASVEQARPIVAQYIEHLAEKYNMPNSKIMVTGFSQGGILALDHLVTNQTKAAICYSGFYYFDTDSIRLADKKALLIHGTDDDIILYDYFPLSCNSLDDIGVEVKTLTCEGLGHSIDKAGVEEGLEFIKANLL